MSRWVEDLEGRYVGTLRVLECVDKGTRYSASMWRCRCGCGREVVRQARVLQKALRLGRISGCRACTDARRVVPRTRPIIACRIPRRAIDRVPLWAEALVRRRVGSYGFEGAVPRLLNEGILAQWIAWTEKRHINAVHSVLRRNTCCGEVGVQ
jgi:hypothetical protein